MESELLNIFLLSMGANLLMFAFAYIFQTDKLTDISYSLTFLLVAVYGFVCLSANGAVDVIALALVSLWALRLGGYLFWRIHKMGRDKRFDDIRNNFKSFLGFWVMQGLTVFVIMVSYTLLVSKAGKSMQALAWVAVGISLAGWLIETVSDYQKFVFKQKHPDRFMSEGLWSRIRHPNYLGEILFWTGMSLLASVYLEGLRAIVQWISPIWIALIIIEFSGVPPLEKSWEKRYGDDPKFQAYLKRSWRMIPFVW